jgi:integrase/recombinase XerD
LGVARWSQTKNKWFIDKNKFDLNRLLSVLKEKAVVDYSGLKENNTTPVPAEIEQSLTTLKLWMKHKRYSESTIKTYLDSAKSFLLFVYPKPIKSIANEYMVRYVNEYIIKRGLSFSYQNQAVNAIKLFFREVVHSALDFDKLERPRREHKLPNVLSKEEIKQILNAHSNIKHRAMFSLIYACGLRRGELLNLKPLDVDSKR